MQAVVPCQQFGILLDIAVRGLILAGEDDGRLVASGSRGHTSVLLVGVKDDEDAGMQIPLGIRQFIDQFLAGVVEIGGSDPVAFGIGMQQIVDQIL